MSFPSVNGETAKLLILGTFGVIIALIVAVTAITVAGDPVPPEIYAALTLLVGVLAGTRITPPDVSAQIKEEATKTVPPNGTPPA